MFGATEHHGNQETGDKSAIGMNIMDMMLAIPVVSVLMYQNTALTMSTEEMPLGCCDKFI